MGSEKSGLIFVIGAPGSGKGTLCKRLANDYGFRHMSVGDLLRNMIASSRASKMIAEHVREGRVLPPDIIFQALQEPIKEANGQNPIILDGFPRKLDQAAPIEAAFGLPELVLLFDCPPEVAEERVVTRRLNREGDDHETFRRRYKEFTELNPVLLQYYGDKGILVKINTNTGIDESYANVVDAIRGRCKWMS